MIEYHSFTSYVFACLKQTIKFIFNFLLRLTINFVIFNYPDSNATYHSFTAIDKNDKNKLKSVLGNQLIN